jgi:hypothetical protein
MTRLTVLVNSFKSALLLIVNSHFEVLSLLISFEPQTGQMVSVLSSFSSQFLHLSEASTLLHDLTSEPSTMSLPLAPVFFLSFQQQDLLGVDQDIQFSY